MTLTLEIIIDASRLCPKCGKPWVKGTRAHPAPAKGPCLRCRDDGKTDPRPPSRLTTAGPAQGRGSRA